MTTYTKILLIIPATILISLLAGCGSGNSGDTSVSIDQISENEPEIVQANQVGNEIVDANSVQDLESNSETEISTKSIEALEVEEGFLFDSTYPLSVSVVVPESDAKQMFLRICDETPGSKGACIFEQNIEPGSLDVQLTLANHITSLKAEIWTIADDLNMTEYVWTTQLGNSWEIY